MTDEEDYDAGELEQAEALASALDRGRASEALDDGALQTAALLRYSRDAGELPAARRDAILEDVLGHADAAAAKRAASAPAPWWRRWGLALGLAAAVAIAMMIVIRPGSEPIATELPAPSASLLEGLLARGAGESPEGLEPDLRAYRGQVYAALSRRYGR